MALGLPVHLGLSPTDGMQLTTVMEAALTILIIENEPFEVTTAMLIDASREMHTLESKVARATSDTAYRTARDGVTPPHRPRMTVAGLVWLRADAGQ